MSGRAAQRSMIAAAAAALAGCAATQEASWPISERWAVRENASEACVSAARRATKYCLDTTVNSDIAGRYTSECTRARWDYTRNCN